MNGPVTHTHALAEAVRAHATRVREAGLGANSSFLFDAAALIRVLAQVIEGKPVHRALGAPGDWGYDTPIGAALARALPDMPGPAPATAERVGTAGDSAPPFTTEVAHADDGTLIGWRLRLDDGEALLVWADRSVMSGFRVGAAFAAGIGQTIRYAPVAVGVRS